MDNNETFQNAEIRALFEKLDRGEKLTDEEVNKIKYHQSEKEKTALDKIVRGVNDIYVHEYTFEDYGGLEITVKIKAPNAIEQGKINAVRENFLGGTGTMVNTFTYVVFHTFALLQVCGIDVPKEIEPENVFNMNIIYKIGVDFADWLDRFQY